MLQYSVYMALPPLDPLCCNTQYGSATTRSFMLQLKSSNLIVCSDSLHENAVMLTV